VTVSVAFRQATTDHRVVRYRLIAVCAAWGLFWGAWSGLIPAVQQRVGVSTGSLGLLLTLVAVGAIPAMVFTGRLARGREPLALAAATVSFGVSIAALAVASSPATLGACLVAVGMTSGALDVCLSMAVARAERSTGARLFQVVHAAFPVLVVVAAPTAGLARQLGVPLPVILLVVADRQDAVETGGRAVPGSRGRLTGTVAPRAVRVLASAHAA
jgi:hypothetical protein